MSTSSIIIIVNIDSSQQMNILDTSQLSDSSVWDDPVYNISIRGGPKGETDCRLLLTQLNEAKIQQFKLSASFQEQYQLIQFEKELRIQIHGVEHENAVQEKQYRKRYINRPVGYPREEIMDLGDQQFKGEIFMETFKQEIEQMETQYNYKIFCQKNKLRIFMHEGARMNTFCLNKLWELKSTLQMFATTHQNLLIILNSSIKLRKKLSDLKIQSRIHSFRGGFWGLFYSKQYKTFQIMEKLQQVARYDIVILNFQHNSLSKTQNIGIYSVLKDSISQKITQIQELFEINIEFNDQRNSLVIHHQHQSFKTQPLAAVKQLLKNLMIISVKTKDIRDFDNKVRKLLKQLPFMKERMNGSRSQTFLCLDFQALYTNTKKDESPSINPKYLKKFLQLFTGIAGQKMQIKIYFTHIQKQQQMIYHFINLADQNNLIVINYDRLIQNQDKKAIFKLKDYSEVVSAKRQREILQFMESILINRLDNSKACESIIESFLAEQNFINLSTTASVDQHLPSFSSSVSERYKAKWLTLPFKMPVIKDYEQEKIAFVKYSKNRQLQKLFNSQGVFKFKGWNLQLSKTLHLPQQVQEHPYIVKRPFRGVKINDTYQLCGLQTFKIDEQGAVVFMKKNIQDQGDFIPVYYFQRIG